MRQNKKLPLISVLLTGSELVEGRLQDSNSLFVARYLDDRGLKLSSIIVCDDDEQKIIANLKYLCTDNDVVIVSGGLGPTSGDKTREAIARFLDKKLIIDQPSLQRIKDFFISRNRPYTANNDKQALIPEDSEVIENEFGTATCFAAKASKSDSDFTVIYALPGVPREFEALFQTKVVASLKRHFDFLDLSQNKLANAHLGIFGVSEAAISDSVKSAKMDSSVVVSYRATFPEVRVLIKAADHSISSESVKSNAERAIEHIGKDFVFSKSGENLAEVAHQLLLQSNKKLAFAESCSAGMLSSLIASNAGCSSYFLGSIVCYDNKIKEHQLGVDPDLINKHGAVSAEVAAQMAVKCQQKFEADIAISITGIAGPDGGSAEKPVGTVYMGFIFEGKLKVFKIFYPASRERIREYVCHLALDQIRRTLVGAERGIEAIPSIEAVI